MKPTPSPSIVTMTTAALMCGFIAAAGADGSRTADLEQTFIRQVVEQTTRSGLAVHSTRDLQAGTLDGKHEGWMRVSTTLTPAGAFAWTVIDQGGSDRTRDKVFRAVLETEADAWRHGGHDAAALTPANYRFALISRDARQVKIRLTPKREDKRLVDGVLTVSHDGYPLRLEGKLAKSPSFWVKSVRVVREYGRFAGVALPTRLESTADVRFVGKARFTMRYHYREVNGQQFATSTTLAASGQ